MTDVELIRRKASLGRTARAVLGSFFGVRRGADLDRDQAELNPVHVAVAGIAAASLFVIALVLLVRWVVTSGVAG
jgi:hypothetical protein